MKTIIDTQQALVTVFENGEEKSYAMASAEGFAAASRAWLLAGWDAKYVYSFTWLGRPIIQLPEDLIRIQELIWAERPDVIVETGIAHGGSLIFFASLFEAMGNGRVIGIDIDIRAPNRAAIEGHRLSSRIALVEGSSVSPAVAAQVAGLVAPGEKVMVILDSDHSGSHVLAELRTYAPLVGVGGRIVVQDTIIADLAGRPRSDPAWATDNPLQAVHAFLAEDDRFALDEPKWLFNEGSVRERVTNWPSCHLKRVR
ncbi:MAG TPA: CmcI family methyltransferase [Allosphingosinicella sp.]|jgi:cephalosporin hydroxylase